MQAETAALLLKDERARECSNQRQLHVDKQMHSHVQVMRALTAHLAEGDLGLVAIFGIQVMCQLNTFPHMPLIHELQLSVVREGMPVDYSLPDGILYCLRCAKAC